MSSNRIKQQNRVDVILAKGNEVTLFDIKNQSDKSRRRTKISETMMSCCAYLAVKSYPSNVRCFLAFPFDPHSGKFWTKEGGKVAPLIHKTEALVADEFWDKLTGVEGTTGIIEETFKDLGAEFGQKFSSHFK